MSHSRVKWRGDALKREIAEDCVRGLDEIDLRIEEAAKAELYPGHGKLTGTLQRDIQAQPARWQGTKVVGRVGTRKLRYAMRIHQRYRYLTIGLEKVRPSAKAILARHRRGR